MKLEEFQDEIDWWGSEEDGFILRVENQQAWKVSAADIVARNYNLDLKNPYAGKVVSHNPDELLSTYQTQQKEIQSIRDQLKAILSEALGKAA